jgi:hypothetical protein
MKEIRTEIEIGAPIQQVWKELTAFAAYSEWNPFIRKVSGNAIPGERLTIRIQPPESRGMTFRPLVLAAAAPIELRWKGKLLVQGLFDGEHSFRLHAIDSGRTKFVQSEVFSGILVPLFGGTLEATRRGFELMNEALKERAEGRGRSG